MATLFDHGINISLDVLEVENQLKKAVCQRFKDEGSVRPAPLHDGLYTVGALDYNDYNPSSTTTKGAFHRTIISVFQFPTATNPGIQRPPIVIPPQAVLANHL